MIQHLAWDDEIEVAGSVLANSSRLGTEVLVEIASSKGQDHLLAISGRPNLPAAVTDVIVDRGEAQGDPQSSPTMPARSFPTRAFPASSPAPVRTTNWSRSSAFAPISRQSSCADLLRRAKETVRARLLAIAPPAVQEEIKRVLNEIARKAPAPGRSFGVAEELVKLMKGLNELDDAAVYNFAEIEKVRRGHGRNRGSQ